MPRDTMERLKWHHDLQRVHLNSSTSLMQRSELRLVDPYFTAVTAGTMAIAKVANAVVTGIRVKEAQKGLAFVKDVVTDMSENAADQCFMMRTLQLQGIMANIVVLGFADSVESSPAIAKLPKLVELQADIRKSAADVVLALERLVQTACHDSGTQQFVLFEKIAMLNERIEKLKDQLVADSIAAFMDVGQALPGIEQIGRLLTSASDLAGGESPIKNPLQQGLEETRKLKEVWDDTVRPFLAELELALAERRERKHEDGTAVEERGNDGLETLMQAMVKGLDAAAGVFIALVVFRGDGDSKNILKRAMLLLQDATKLIKEKRAATTLEMLLMMSSMVSLAISALNKAGAEHIPGLHYAVLSLMTLADMLQLTENSVLYSNEEREYSLLKSSASQVQLHNHLTKSLATCTNLVQASDLARHQERMVIQFVDLLPSDGGSAQVNRDAAGKSFESLCFQFPSMCMGMVSELVKEASVGNVVAEQVDMLRLLYEVLPISELAFKEKSAELTRYIPMGFQDVHGLETVLVCRGCGPGVIFKVVLLDSSEKIGQAQDKFADGLDIDGNKLPKHAVLNYLTFSDTVFHQVGFYKAPFREVLATSSDAQVLVEFHSVAVRLDDVEDRARVEVWRSVVKETLEGSGAQLLAASKTRIAETRFDAFTKFVRGSGGGSSLGLHSLGRVKGYDEFDSMVAVFAPASLFPTLSAENKEHSEHEQLDWRDAVLPGLKAPFTHVSVLRGCGCALVFASEYSTFLPGFKHESLRNVKVAPLFQPYRARQNERCHLAVGIYASSAPLNIPSKLQTGDARCSVEETKPLKEAVPSVGHIMVLQHLVENEAYWKKHFPQQFGSKVFLRLDRGWNVMENFEVNESSGVAVLNVPQVLDDDGASFDLTFWVIRTPDPEAPSKGTGVATIPPAELEYMRRGGPLKEFVDKIQSLLCSKGSNPRCSFSDDTIKVALNLTLSGSPLISGSSDSVKGAFADFSVMPGASRFDMVSTNVFGWSSCTRPAGWWPLHLETLADVEAKLGGKVQVTGAGPLPSELKKMSKISVDRECDYALWIVVRVCPDGQRGVVAADEQGKLFTICDPSKMKARPANAVGPSASLFIQISLNSGNMEKGYKRWDVDSMHVSSKNGYVRIDPTKDEYVSEETFYAGFEKTQRRVRIRAFAQIDPRVAATRGDACPVMAA